MTFDWKIDIGQIVIIVTFLIASFRMHTTNVKRIQDMKTKFDIMFVGYQKWIRMEPKLNIMFKWFEKHVMKSCDVEEGE